MQNARDVSTVLHITTAILAVMLYTYQLAYKLFHAEYEVQLYHCLRQTNLRESQFFNISTQADGTPS